VFVVGALPANTSSAFQVEVLDSLMAFNPARAYRLYVTYSNANSDEFMRESVRLPPEGVLDAAAINQVAIRVEFEPAMKAAEQRGYVVTYADDYVKIFRRPSPPKCYFTSAYSVQDEAGALQAVAAPRANGTVLLEETPVFASGLPQHEFSPVRTIVRRRNSVTIEVEAPSPGLLYCGDNIADGWHAEVNGRPASIMTANYAYRAVAVMAGRSIVQFDYWPPGLTRGLWVSSVSAGLCLMAVIGGWRRLDRSLAREADARASIGSANSRHLDSASPDAKSLAQID
jgi:hypothetical protein